MRKLFSWKVVLAFILLILSAFFYFLHYMIFKDAHHIFLYLLGDIAFLFVDVLIVTLVLHRLLLFQERRSVLKKLNMVIGTFFSEVGSELLRQCHGFNQNEAMGRHLVVSKDWTDKDFAKAVKSVRKHESSICCKSASLKEVKDFLVGRRQFLLNLLENSNLLEHESFTNLLWAVFHLTDELAHRRDLARLPEADYKHLAGDIARVYQQLVLQWLNYMKHLKKEYPYLFSLAIRTNPFDPDACVEIQ